MRTLDVFSDVVCPWCFLGRRRLDAALAALAEDERPTVRWRAFQLDPTMPEGRAEPARPKLEAKLGGPQRFAMAFERVRALGEEVGIAFNIDKPQSYNTRLAHRAVAFARTHGAAHEHAAVDALFSAHFELGKDLSDPDVVARVLTDAGVPGGTASMADALRAGAGNDDVTADLRLCRELGVSGVPLFVLDGKLAVSGAQDAAVLIDFLRSS